MTDQSVLPDPCEASKALLSFLDKSATPFHAAALVQERLMAEGFVRLDEADSWHLQASGRYFLQRNGSAVIAFVLPDTLSAATGLHMVATHLDSPSLHLKPKALRKASGRSIVPTEVYGSPIIATWLDRPLGIAGRVFREGDDGRVQGELFAVPNAAVIPNPAIHLTPDVNTKGIVYNAQRELNALIGLDKGAESSGWLFPGDCVDMECQLFDCQPACLIGDGQELLQGPRLDNLLSAYAALAALPASKPSGTIALSFWADNEEIGSRTRQGADSDFLQTAVRRIGLALGATAEETARAMACSLLLSADAAHGVHPSFPDYSEPSAAPQLGKGFALKRNVKFRYASNGAELAAFRLFCRRSGVSCQDFTNRADMPCGSTIGPALSAQLGIPAIDIGVPMLAMHSLRETAALADALELEKLVGCFWNSMNF